MRSVRPDILNLGLSSRLLGLTISLFLAAGSLAARSLADVEYAKAGTEPLLLDAYIPDGDGPFPAVILVHGGAWVTGDKRRNVQPLFQPLRNAKYAWFSINYRLARGADPTSLINLATLQTLSSAVEDVRHAVAYVQQHAAEYSIDPTRVILVGESAGAHLISMAALRPAASGPPGSETSPIRGAIAFYSPSDLQALVENSSAIPDSLRRAVKGTALESLLMAGLRELSPKTWISSSAPPFLLIHGNSDSLVPVQQSRDMCAALQKAGARCELFVVDGAGHGMNGWESRSGMTDYKPIMMEWLAKVLQ